MLAFTIFKRLFDMVKYSWMKNKGSTSKNVVMYLLWFFHKFHYATILDFNGIITFYIVLIIRLDD